MFGYKLFYAIFACVPDPESGRKPFRSETAGRTADRSFLTVTGRRAFRKAPFYRHTKSILPMKRFLTFLFAASALLAGGCSDSDTDDPAPPEAPAPVIKLPEAVAASPLSVSPEGGTSWFEYEVENPVEGEAIAASTTDAWVHSFDYSVSGRIGFSFDPSEGEVRIANVALTYKGAEKKVVTLLQPAPETPELTFDIRVSGIDGSSAVVAWTPSDDTASYVPMVVEKSLFDSYATEVDYIRSDIEYIQGQADLAGKTFAEMLDMFLTTGPTGEQTISGLASDTDYYAYAYGMTAEGVATSAISKTEFRTGPFSCEFAIAHEETESTCDVEVTPSNTGCFYYFDLAAKADFDTWGTDAEIVASVVADLKETAAYYQASGYDLDWTDFLSIGPDGYEFTKLSPDTEYVVYAFALTEEGRPLTGVTRETVRTEAFVPTDDCTFGISFRNVSVTAFDISVRPSNAATRYYIGVCSKELFDKNTPSSIADAFIEMENGYERIHLDGRRDGRHRRRSGDGRPRRGNRLRGRRLRRQHRGRTHDGGRQRGAANLRTCSFDDDDRPERPRRYGFGRQIRRNAVEYRRGLFRRRLRLR